jgi:hypothetical protein
MRSTKTLSSVLAVLVVASCGGSSKQAAPAAPPVSLAIATTAAPTTAPPATVQPPTAPPTTVAPTTTTMSLQDLEKVVRARFLEIVGPKIEGCLANPVACDPSEFTAQEGPARAAYVKAVQAYVEHNWIARELSADSSYTVIQSITFDAKRTRATVLSCHWDTGVILQPAAAPDGSDIIVNDLKNSYEHDSLMVFENGTWKMSDKRDVTKHQGVNTCPPRG